MASTATATLITPKCKRGRVHKCTRCPVEGEGGKVKSHIYKIHLALERAPYHCTLCLFRSTKKGSFDNHIKSFGPHKQRMVDARSRDENCTDQDFMRQALNPYFLQENVDYIRYDQSSSDNTWESRRKKAHSAKEDILGAAIQQSGLLDDLDGDWCETSEGVAAESAAQLMKGLDDNLKPIGVDQRIVTAALDLSASSPSTVDIPSRPPQAAPTKVPEAMDLSSTAEQVIEVGATVDLCEVDRDITNKPKVSDQVQVEEKSAKSPVEEKKVEIEIMQNEVRPEDSISNVDSHRPSGSGSSGSSRSDCPTCNPHITKGVAEGVRRLFEGGDWRCPGMETLLRTLTEQATLQTELMQKQLTEMKRQGKILDDLKKKRDDQEEENLQRTPEDNRAKRKREDDVRPFPLLPPLTPYQPRRFRNFPEKKRRC